MANKKMDLDEPINFYIPTNFVATGTILGGMLKVRNVVEAIVVVLLIGFPIYNIPMGLTLKIVLFICLCIPPAIPALVGVNHGPLSEFLLDVFKYKRLNKKYEYDESHGTKPMEERSDSNEQQK